MTTAVIILNRAFLCHFDILCKMQQPTILIYLEFKHNTLKVLNKYCVLIEDKQSPVPVDVSSCG